MVSKLQINNAKRTRHFWSGIHRVCDCGCKERLYIKNRPCCKQELIEILNDLGYSLEKINEGVGIEKK